MPKTTGRAAPAKPGASRAPASKTTKRTGGNAKAAHVKKAPTKKAATKVTATAKTAPARKAAAKKTAPPKKAALAKKPAAKKSVAKRQVVKNVAPSKAAPVKKVAVKKGPVVLDKFLEGQRAALLEERATYTHQAESLQAEADGHFGNARTFESHPHSEHGLVVGELLAKFLDSWWLHLTNWQIL